MRDKYKTLDGVGSKTITFRSYPGCRTKLVLRTRLVRHPGYELNVIVLDPRPSRVLL